MKKSPKLTTLLAVGAISLGAAFVAAPAFAHEESQGSGGTSEQVKGGHGDPEKAERRAARRAERIARSGDNKMFRRAMRETRKMSRHMMDHCEIAPERLLTTETSPKLNLIKQIIDLKVADGDLSQAEADEKFAYKQIRVTLKTAAKTAMYAPMLELFGVATRKELRDAVDAAGGKDELLESKGISEDDYYAAKREGMIDTHQVIVDLCNSGTEMPDEDTPKDDDESSDDTPKDENGDDHSKGKA